MSPRPNRHRAAGFTLLELLIAVTLFGLLFALVTAGLRFGTTAWQASADSLQRNAEIQTVQSLLRRRLGAARLLRSASANGAVSFAGDETTINFLGSAPAAALRDGIYSYALVVEEVDDVAVLSLSWRWYDHAADPADDDAADEEQQLMGEFADAKFRYFGRPQPDAEPRWLDNWQDRDDLPMLVGVAVRFAPADRREWPALLIEVKGR